MTLSLVVSGGQRAFVSTDHRLSVIVSKRAAVVSDTSPKEITISELGGVYARIGYVGIGGLPGEPTWEWLTKILEGGRGENAWTLSTLCEHIASSGSAWIAPILPGREAELVHLFIVTAVQDGALHVRIVSNAVTGASSHEVRLGPARPRFKVHEIPLPCSLAIGSGAPHVAREDLSSLLAMVDSATDIRTTSDQVARVSWLAAQKEPTVGPSCTVYHHTFSADGSSSGSLNYMANGEYGGVAVDETIYIVGSYVARLSEIIKMAESQQEAKPDGT